MPLLCWERYSMYVLRTNIIAFLVISRTIVHSRSIQIEWDHCSVRYSISIWSYSFKGNNDGLYTGGAGEQKKYLAECYETRAVVTLTATKKQSGQVRHRLRMRPGTALLLNKEKEKKCYSVIAFAVGTRENLKSFWNKLVWLSWTRSAP